MENPAVVLSYLSKTQDIANEKHSQNNQLQALHMLLRRNKMPQMEITRMKPTFTSDGLFMQDHSLCSLPLPFCGLPAHASREKKQLKTSQDLKSSTKKNRVTVHDFKCNDDTTAYHKDEHQNWIVSPRGVKLRFISVNHFFIILQRSEKKSYNQSYAPICLKCICYLFCLICCKISFSYCLWLYCLCLGPPRTDDKSKGNTTPNSKGKKICNISNKWVGKCSSDMLPIYICPCTAAVKIRTVNISTCLIRHIISFLTVKVLLDNVLTLNSEVKDLLDLVWVEAYLLPVTENFMNPDVTLHIYLVKIVYYNDWLLYSFFFNKVQKSNP